MSDHIADVSKMVDKNPGVQGLAQLGRNAIDRTSSLERTIATLRMRLRRAGQLLIEEIGADGPESADDTAERAAVVIRNQADAIAALSSQLGNLLAVIHRDGGHYESEHGTEEACADAETAVHVLRGSLEGYVEANRYMKGELDDALEDARKYCEAKREIARRVEAAYREAVDTLNPCFATAGALWEGSNARKQLEAK